MLNEEEKQAIKIFKSYINAIETFGTIDYKCINNLYEPAKTVLNHITKLQEENKEKDKQIDLMAEEIEYNGCIKRVWNCEEKSCKECIKQYFKKLAEEKGEY